jgi:hypothetical protein
MTRRQLQIRPHLHPNATPSLPPSDIRAILRAADGIIGAGGRTLLSSILKGSRAKDVLSHGLEQNPAHGYYRGLSTEEVLARIDWMIVHGYLHVVYDGRLPMLAYTPAGWDIERETYATEIVAGFDQLLASGARPYAMHYLKDRNRGMVLLVLEKVQASGDPKYLPVLEDWEQVDCKKVRQAIGAVRR